MAITQFDELVNKATSTLRIAHTAGDGTLKVFDASTFPSTGRVTCYQGTGPLSEQVYAILAYSAVDLSTNTLTVTGAIEGTTDVNMPARTRIEIRGTAGQWNELTAAVNALEESGGGSGTVTSVGLEVPTGLEVSGSPVTDAGTITIATSLEGIVLATNGGFEAATAGTDYLTPSDIASIPASSITGTLPVAHGGTGLTALGAADQILLVKHDGSQLNYKNLTAGDNVTIAVDATDVTINAASSGTVESVALSVPSGLSVSGSPITTSGTLAVTTTLNGIVKGDGSGFSVATGGADYVRPKRTVASGSDFYISADDYLVAITGTGTHFVYLPTAANCVPGQRIVITDEAGIAGTTAIVMRPNGLDTLQGTISGALNVDYGSISFYTDGVSKWFTSDRALYGDTGITVTQDAFGETIIGSTDVKSVALSMPGGLTVSGSPITSTGTLAVTTTLSGLVKGTGSGFGVATPDVDYTTKSYVDTGLSAKGDGTVKSVALSLPTGLTVSGSPITTSGTLAVTTTLSGMVKADGSGFTTGTAGTDYVSPSGLSTALSGYVDLSSNQTITGTKTFGQTQIYTSGSSDKVTSANTELVLEQTGDTLGATRLHLQGRAGLTGALFECATGYDVIDFGFKSGSYTRSLRAEYRTEFTYSHSPEFTLGDNSSGVDSKASFYSGDLGSGAFGHFVLAPISGRDYSIAAPAALLDVRGSLSLSFRVTSSDTTLTADDYEIMVSGNSSAVTITLPEIGSAGIRFVVSDVAGTAATYNITIVVEGGHYLNASTSAVINTNYKQLHFVCTGIGSNYYYAP